MVRIVVDLALADLDQLPCPAQHARGGAAVLNVGTGADGLELELSVEGRNFQHADIGHAEHLGDLFNGRAGDPAVLILRTHKQRDDSRLLTAGRIKRDALFGPGCVSIIKGETCRLNRLVCKASHAHQRSTSPNTISIDPRIAVTSASMWPRQSQSMALRWAKPGARM